MFFKLSMFSASMLLVLSGALCAQGLSTSDSSVGVGKGGRIVLASSTETSGKFSLIDNKGMTTHSGTWNKQDGYLAWTSKTGEPAIQGSTYWVEGAWRVYWNVIPTLQNPNVASGTTSITPQGQVVAKGKSVKPSNAKLVRNKKAPIEVRLVSKSRNTKTMKSFSHTLAKNSIRSNKTSKKVPAKSSRAKKPAKLTLCFESKDAKDNAVRNQPQPTTIVAFRGREISPKKSIGKKHFYGARRLIAARQGTTNQR
ncbi:MAG: hypothetical protein ACI97A_001610 [Planctomycetota bacterium]|jgi:hypothetical protein